MISKKYLVMTMSEAGDLKAEILERDVLIARITPKPGERDTYYGGDYGIAFVDFISELKTFHKEPMRLLVYEVGNAVKPKKMETVVRYDLP